MTGRLMLVSRLPGLLLAAVAGLGSVAVAEFVPMVSSLLLAMGVGILVGNLAPVPDAARPGLAVAAKTLLRVGIVVLGLQVAITDLLDLGSRGMVVLTVTVAVAFSATAMAGSLLRLSVHTRYSIAAGFSICGASAVAAISAVTDPEGRGEEETAQAIALVTLYGTIAMVLLPFAQPFTGFDDDQMGLWLGASVHEVAQVVAAGSAVSIAALAVATIAKLGRVVLLAPVVATVAVVAGRRAPEGSGREPRSSGVPMVPMFVVGFLLAVLVRSVLPLTEPVVSSAAWVATGLLAIAMFALGVGVDLPRLVRTGGRPLILGAIATVVVTLTPLTLIHLLG